MAANWFEADHVEPLAIPAGLDAFGRARDFVSCRIVEALLLLRIEPGSLYASLAASPRSVAWSCLIALFRNETFPQGPSYWVVSDDDCERTLKAASEALGRLARDALHRIVSHDRLMETWLAVEDTDKALADHIAELKWWRDAPDFRLTAQERETDEACLRAALAGRIEP